MTDLQELRVLAVEIAREAGALILAKRAAGVQIAQTKSSATDIVTEADRASETLIQDRILAARPDDGLLGEEGAAREGTSGVRWIIDPIDGTVNYAHGLPHYAVSIGVEVAGVPSVGVVLAPALGLEYSAVLGGGAECNGRRLQVAAAVPLSSALVGTGFSYERSLRISQTRTLAVLLPQIADIRRNGSCALDLCAVADGLLDGYVEEGIGGPWDYVGGRVIAHEAGARSEVLTGAAGRILVVASPASTYPDFRAAVEASGFVESGASKDPV